MYSWILVETVKQNSMYMIAFREVFNCLCMDTTILGGPYKILCNQFSMKNMTHSQNKCYFLWEGINSWCLSQRITFKMLDIEDSFLSHSFIKKVYTPYFTDKVTWEEILSRGKLLNLWIYINFPDKRPSRSPLSRSCLVVHYY